MSAGDKETPRDTTCQSGTAFFFSNPLMSDFESDWSPIHDAAFNGRVLALQRLIAQGTCVNLNTLNQVSPLHGACLQGHVACAKLLVENGAKVNSSTVDGQTALSEACARGHVTCVSLLLQQGATPLGTSHTSSPIHRAAAKGHTECIELLVEHGAAVDQYIDQSGFPLHVACSNQHLSSVCKLLQLDLLWSSDVLGLSLGNTDFQLPPKIFYGVEIWRLARPLQDLEATPLPGRCVWDHCYAERPSHVSSSMPLLMEGGFHSKPHDTWPHSFFPLHGSVVLVPLQKNSPKA
ncbi:ankyrin repeat and SOCS box protein 11-like isoform X2 [Sander vitreus]